MKKAHSLAIVKENNKYFEQESVLDPSKNANKYDPKKKYAVFVKGMHKDGSESIYFIKYIDDMQEIQEYIRGYKSWFNYPLNLYKSVGGDIKELS